ncbi:Crp/Fnr family transcriptional regulator [Rhizobium sp. CC-YZS058]|uniref:Crp/Fnr family transcriptional regulator n=1 Tax=Rhizobium sp. CC-YZS058 TaxID=3042153 RepID=UPI002B058DF7|nr:Crp/Fnr family transcriptional regulator [Rhizobium sp. CC-YZS058]MEA3536297.1 Crp/Fnr family transcriptional regulator [Rhizobium sp. CC-YZS058]
MIDILIRSLENHDIISEAERAQLRAVLDKEKEVEPDEDIVKQGSRPLVSTVLTAGFAARYKLTAEGSRQITALHVPGDFVDLHAFMLKTMDHGIVALSTCRIVTVDHTDLLTLSHTAPHLTRLFWLKTLVDGAVHREWIVAMGRRSKRAHLAHLICELFVRLRAVGLTEGNGFHFPLSQGEMADVLGLSLVHMNRTIQGLRRDGLISWTNQTIEILKWDELAAIADFDETYLSLSVEPR